MVPGAMREVGGLAEKVSVLDLGTREVRLQGAHVTDKLVVGVYSEPNAEGTPLRLIASGTPLEVIKKGQGFSEVRLADDTRGWVESSYITEEKPAKAMLLETQAKLRQMGMELAGLREKAAAEGGATAGTTASAASSAAPTAREAQLRKSLQQAEQRIADLEQELAEVPRDQAARAELETLRVRTAEALRLLADAQGLQLSAGVAPPPGFLQRYRGWVIGGGALLLGFGAGIAFIDYRIRKRYGGFRI